MAEDAREVVEARLRAADRTFQFPQAIDDWAFDLDTLELCEFSLDDLELKSIPQTLPGLARVAIRDFCGSQSGGFGAREFLVKLDAIFRDETNQADLIQIVALRYSTEPYTGSAIVALSELIGRICDDAYPKTADVITWQRTYDRTVSFGISFTTTELRERYQPAQVFEYIIVDYDLADEQFWFIERPSSLITPTAPFVRFLGSTPKQASQDNTAAEKRGYFLVDYDPASNEIVFPPFHRATGPWTDAELRAFSEKFAAVFRSSIERLNASHHLAKAMADFGARFVRLEVEAYTVLLGDFHKVRGLQAAIDDNLEVLLTLAESGHPHPVVQDDSRRSAVGLRFSFFCGSTSFILDNLIKATDYVSETCDTQRMSPEEVFLQAARAHPPLVWPEHPISEKTRRELAKFIYDSIENAEIEDARGLKGHRKLKEDVELYGGRYIRFEFAAPRIEEFLDTSGVADYGRGKIKLLSQHCRWKWQFPTEYYRIVHGDSAQERPANLIVSPLHRSLYLDLERWHTYGLKLESAAAKAAKDLNRIFDGESLPSREADPELWREIESLRAKLRSLPDPSDSEDVPRERHFTTLDDPAAERIFERLALIGTNLDVSRDEARTEIDAVLQELAGKAFATLDLNQRMTRNIKDKLKRAGLRVKCVRKEGCDGEGLPDWKPARGMPAGAFYVVHNGTAHGGMPEFPPLQTTRSKPHKRAHPL